MKNIFKYTFLQRFPAIILSWVIMTAVGGAELLFLLFVRNDVMDGFYSLWLILTVAVLAIVPLQSFVKCGNGYARSILFTNESYLFFTLPVPAERMLLGRMLCGFVELVSYFFVSIILLSILAPIWLYRYMAIDSEELLKFYFRIPDILMHNIQGLTVLFFIFVIGFILLGNVTLFVNVIVRSFNIKRMRALQIIGGAIFFIMMLFVIGKVQAFFDEHMKHFSIDVHGITYENGVMTYTSGHLDIPVVSIMTALIFGVILFYASVWLVKKKVEVFS